MQEAGKIYKRIWEELEEDVNGKIKKFVLCLGQYLAKDVFVKYLPATQRYAEDETK